MSKKTGKAQSSQGVGAETAAKPTTESVRRSIASRLQNLIDQRYKTFYAVESALEANGDAALAVTLRGWLPPWEIWHSEQPYGAAMEEPDWIGIRTPSALRLADLCGFLGADVGWVLTGKGSQWTGEKRSPTQLDADLEARIRREARQLARRRLPLNAFTIEAASLLADMVNSVVTEYDEYERWYWKKYVTYLTVVRKFLELSAKSGATGPSRRAQRAEIEIAARLLATMAENESPQLRYIAPNRDSLVFQEWPPDVLSQAQKELDAVYRGKKRSAK